jgi:hypothetical protein
MAQRPVDGGAGDHEHPLPREALGDSLLIVAGDRRFIHAHH